MTRAKLRLIVGALALAGSAFGGSIIVDNDEWTLSNAGFTMAGATNVTNFAQNAALFLTGASGGKSIWIDSSNFSLTGTDLQTALGAYTLTDTGTFSDFTLPTLQGYQAVFLAGNNLTAADLNALIAYVNSGGSVYVAAGTGAITGGAAGEAAQWNVFLNPFSLNLASSYNPFVGVFPTNSTSSLLNGVTQLFYENGNSVTTTGPGAQITSQASGQGLIATFTSTPSVPEPSTLLLIGMGMAGLGLYRRKHRRS